MEQNSLCLPFRRLRQYGLALLAAGSVCCSGCRRETSETSEPSSIEAIPEAAAAPAPGEQGLLSGALDALKDGASRVQKAVQPYASPIQSTAVESVQKMFAIDYRIIEVGLDESSEKLEARLNELGVERWDCSTMPPTGGNARFLCKRVPMTSYLKALSLLTKLTPE